MRRRPMVLAGAAALGLGLLAWGLRPRGLSAAAFAAQYADPLAPLPGPVPVYHLGHSLVGRDMPAMLAQVAGHSHASQLGWGVSLRDHWTGEVRGLAEENRAPAFRPAPEAVDSGDYPVVVLTEMVELRDAIRYHDSARHLAKWVERIRRARPEARVYLYETWHRLDDPAGWLDRIDTDRAALWEDQVLRPASGAGVVHVIPGGQVLAAAVRAAEAGQVPGIAERQAFFARGAEGAVDTIHLNDLGHWLIAMAHYAVIYARDPSGLPGALRRADGTPADPVPPDAAAALQAVVWRVVTGYALTGVGSGR